MTEQSNPDDTYTTLDGTRMQTVLSSLQEEAENATISPTFICEFNSPVNPQQLLDAVFKSDETNYDATAFPLKVSSDDEYYQVNGVVGIRNGNGVKLDAEICPEWMRVYVRSDTQPDSLTNFFNTFYEEYPFEIVVANEYLTN